MLPSFLMNFHHTLPEPSGSRALICVLRRTARRIHCAALVHCHHGYSTVSLRVREDVLRERLEGETEYPTRVHRRYANGPCGGCRSRVSNGTRQRIPTARIHRRGSWRAIRLPILLLYFISGVQLGGRIILVPAVNIHLRPHDPECTVQEIKPDYTSSSISSRRLVKSNVAGNHGNRHMPPYSRLQDP